MNEIENKVSALLAKMTLDQKIGQLLQPERQFVTPEDVKKYHIGSVLSGGGLAVLYFIVARRAFHLPIRLQ